ncbi:hypothetical protein ACLB2K_051966 [Fragaria x ananassa]
MASLPLSTSSLTLLFLISMFPSSTLSQNSNPSIPTVAQCAPRLLPLATCAPFVQGTAPSPGQSCCDNLNLVYSQQPRCLCLLLNSNALSSFTVNFTLALQLPALCTLPVDASVCSGSAQVPPSSPSSQVSLGANSTSPATNSTVAASPMVQAPPPRSTSNGGSASTSLKLNMGSYVVTVIMAGFLMTGVLF